jgi:hypothetical protein
MEKTDRRAIYKVCMTYDFGMRASAKLTHMFECTVGPVTHFVCVPDVTGTIPVSVVKKGLGTPR